MKHISGVLLLVILNIIGPLRLFKFDYVVVDLAETIYHVKELALGRVPYGWNVQA